MAKVKFSQNDVLIDGKVVGRVTGGSGPLWVTINNQFAMRVKYGPKKRTKAKKTLSEALGRMSVDEYLSRVKGGESPMKLSGEIS